MQAIQMSEILLAILLGLDPTQPIDQQLSQRLHQDEVVVGYVRKGEGCIGLAQRLGHMIGPKGCTLTAKRFNRPTVGLFTQDISGPVEVEMVMYPDEAWAVERKDGKVVYFGPLSHLHKKK